MINGIFVTLSGGGFRATAYHAGTFWVLDRLGLLESVTGLSSASGGTIFAARWLNSRKRGVPYAVFFDETVRYMLGTNVIAQAAHNLLVHSKEDARARTLIVGAADAYAQDPGIGWLTFGELLPLPGPLRELSLNATEFSGGLGFRFVCSDGEAVFGNGHFDVPDEVVQKIRLADIVAASSAFPGGFEPIAFPQDFRWGVDREAVLAALKGRRGFAHPVPLMDGGIDDNQGVDSLALALDRKGVKRPQMLLVSDVHQWDVPLYEQNEAQPPSGWKLAHLETLAGATWLFALLATAASAGAFVTSLNQPWWRSVLAGLSFALCGSIFWGLHTLRERVKSLLHPYWYHPRYPVAKYWDQLKHMHLSEAFGLLALRGRSMLALTARVFMKRVRDSVREAAAETFGRTAIAWSSIYLFWKEQNHVYAVGEPEPSTKAAQTIALANQMQTILWAESADEVAQLYAAIATGRLTTCAAVIRWVDKQPVPIGPELLALRQRAHALLARLDADPQLEIPL